MVLAACGDDRAESPAAASSPIVTAASSVATGAVPDSLAFSAPLVGGGTLDFSQYAGKPVLLWFWAPT
jgi:hypothetical protein